MKLKHAELKEIITKLNHLELEGIESIRIVAVKGEALVEKFLSTIDAIDDASMTEKLPPEIIEAYNNLIVAIEAGGTGLELVGDAQKEKAEKKTVEKQEKVAKKVKEKRERAPANPHKGKERSRYDHIKEAISGQLDDLLYEGNTVAFMMEILGIKRQRVVGHAKHLKNDLGLTLIETKPEGVDVKLNDTHYKVEEESWIKE